jgi:hypothetical protein
MFPDFHQEWSLQRCSAAEIRSVLDASYVKLSQGKKVARPLNSNSVVLNYFGGDPANSREGALPDIRWAQFFAEFHPGRIFCFTSKATSEELMLPDGSVLGESLVAGGVVASGNDGHARYSDVVFGQLESFEPAAFLSVLRGQLQVGFRPSIAIMGSPVSDGVIDGLLEDASDFIFSSRYWSSAPRLFHRLVQSDVELIDLEWIHISLWRAQLRNLALKHDLSDAHECVERVVLITNPTGGGGDSVLPPSGALLLGWIISQFQSRVTSFSHEGIECVSPKGKLWRIEHRVTEEPSSEGVREVQLEFRPQKYSKVPERATIRLNDNFFFETELFFEEKQYHFTGSNRKHRPEDDLFRFFSRGESTTMYRDALSSAREIGDLLYSPLCSYGGGEAFVRRF